jgi:hypothetical protein
MKRGLFVLLGALFVGGAVEAEAQVRPWEISIAGGPSFPVGDLRDEAGTGFHVQGSVGFAMPALPVGLRTDLLYQEVPVTGEDVWIRQIGGLLNATFGLPLMVIEPYALVGAGLLRTEEPHGDHTDTYNLVGFNAGLGLDFPFLGLTGFLEGRYLNLFGGTDATNFQTVPVSFGIRF